RPRALPGSRHLETSSCPEFDVPGDRLSLASGDLPDGIDLNFSPKANDSNAPNARSTSRLWEDLVVFRPVDHERIVHDEHDTGCSTNDAGRSGVGRPRGPDHR